MVFTFKYLLNTTEISLQSFLVVKAFLKLCDSRDLLACGCCGGRCYWSPAWLAFLPFQDTVSHLSRAMQLTLNFVTCALSHLKATCNSSAPFPRLSAPQNLMLT